MKGEQHYKVGIFKDNDLHVLQYSDAKKAERCKENGMKYLPPFRF